MIDEIFAMIMKEARERPGKDLVHNICTVLLDLGQRLDAAMYAIKEQERRERKYGRAH